MWGLGQGYAGTAVKQCRVGEVQWSYASGFLFRIGDLLLKLGFRISKLLFGRSCNPNPLYFNVPELEPDALANVCSGRPASQMRSWLVARPWGPHMS